MGENTSSPRIAMDIFSDSTATTKIGSIKLSEILATEVFDVLAYNYNSNLYLIKSTKENKICVIHEDVMYYQNWGKGNGTTLTTNYKIVDLHHSNRNHFFIIYLTDSKMTEGKYDFYRSVLPLANTGLFLLYNLYQF